MTPRVYSYLDELTEIHKRRIHFDFFLKYKEELTAFDKNRLTRVRSPGFISWYLRWDSSWRDPHPPKLSDWASEEYKIRNSK